MPSEEVRRWSVSVKNTFLCLEDDDCDMELPGSRREFKTCPDLQGVAALGDKKDAESSGPAAESSRIAPAIERAQCVSSGCTTSLDVEWHEKGKPSRESLADEPTPRRRRARRAGQRSKEFKVGSQQSQLQGQSHQRHGRAMSGLPLQSLPKDASSKQEINVSGASNEGASRPRKSRESGSRWADVTPDQSLDDLWDQLEDRLPTGSQDLASKTSPLMHWNAREGTSVVDALADACATAATSPSRVEERACRSHPEIPQPRQRRLQIRSRLWCHLYVSPDMLKHGFDFNKKIIGHGGCCTRAIYDATGAKIRLRGRGSGHLEGGCEAPAPLMLAITGEHGETANFCKAIKMSAELLQDVSRRFQSFCQPRGKHQKGGGRPLAEQSSPLFWVGEISPLGATVAASVLDDLGLSCPEVLQLSSRSTRRTRRRS
eukprot:CAMPEP_0115265010 /NCGR_PEP_ID=MMETSP0270-20121206/50731_1 /TAXON_ID=71861 /ORGANISM="Scrippsiella trochoidea, Strain CCMP3099" /LENGTH=430 /DNA_ID=CAMNT_0002681061 /DNA_START=25 /DNA_END=1317 /DNA_ORIENTATION=-